MWDSTSDKFRGNFIILRAFIRRLMKINDLNVSKKVKREINKIGNKHIIENITEPKVGSLKEKNS